MVACLDPVFHIVYQKVAGSSPAVADYYFVLSPPWVRALPSSKLPNIILDVWHALRRLASGQKSIQQHVDKPNIV